MDNNLSFITIFLCVASFLLFIFYLFLKINKKHTLFSPFSISTYIYAFSIFVLPFFFLKDESWYALGITNASSMKEYLCITLIINHFGFIIFTIFMIISEFSKKRTKVEKVVAKMSFNISATAIDLVFFFSLIVWYLIVFYFNHGIPLFNGGRTFYLNSPISPIYLAFNEIIKMLALFYGIRFLHKRKDLSKFIIATITVMFQANRGSFLVSILATIVVLAVYMPTKSGKTYYQISKKKQRFQFYKLIALFFVLGIAGIALVFVRNRDSFSLSSIVSELFYGNTFSDIRDGAFIFKGFRENTNSAFLYGKSLLSGLISFIPSSFSSFRNTWRWGYYTTGVLWGMENHTGLRGGNCMEAYINFGIFGIITFSIICGYIYGCLERWFNKKYIQTKSKSTEFEFISALIIVNFVSLFICSSGFFNFYVDIVLFIGLRALSILLRKPYNQKKEG